MRSSLVSYLSFAAFGLFWGTWGAALPALRDGAGLTDTQLGSALLFVGLGALPAMAAAGRAIDRWGVRVTGVGLWGLAIAGVLLSYSARDFASAAGGMLLVGAASGFSDVAANASAVHAERQSGRRVITRAHAVFSAAVVAGSLGTGAFLANSGGAVSAFGVSAVAMLAAGAGVFMFGAGPRMLSPQGSRGAGSKPRNLLPFVAVGAVGAFGFAAENAHQSWGAIFLAGELHVSPAFAAIAPATFAAFAAMTRLVVGSSTRIADGVLLGGGASVALTGTLVLAAAQTMPVALSGFALAAVGTSVLFPTLLSRATRDVPEWSQGRATSVIGTTAYLGFLLGPVYVGLLSGSVGLRGAMVGVALLIGAFAVGAPLVSRQRRFSRERSPRRFGARPAISDDRTDVAPSE